MYSALGRISKAALILCFWVCISLSVNAASWHDKTLPEIAAGLAAGEVTSAQLVEEYLARIEAIDRNGPTLNAVLAINPNALADAQRADRQRQQGVVAGPLHGVPILLKDNIESLDPLATTVGSLSMVHNITGRDAPLVAGLRAQGAIVLGKSNLSEWANFRSQASMSGWSALGGQTRNPHMLDRNPCGSSSGSGAGIAASLAAGAVGTETNGSIICPASVNGIVGFKPTVGLISAEGIVPISPTQDTAGPMSKSVMGAAMLLGAMDSTDIDYPAALKGADLTSVRIGVLRAFQGQDVSILPLFDQAIAVLAEQGAQVVEIPTAKPMPDGFQAAAFSVLLHEFKASLNQYLFTGKSKMRSLADVIAFNRASPRELLLFDQSIFLMAQNTQGTQSKPYREARALISKATREEGIDYFLSEYEVDILIAPSGQVAPRIDPVNGDIWADFAGIGWMAAIAGYPHATVPMGTVRRLPIGVSFIAPAGADLEVLKAAYVYEQASNQRVIPGYLPSAGVIPEIAPALEPYRPEN